MQRRVLLVIDFLNEFVDPKGQLASNGYADFIIAHNTIGHLNTAIRAFRESGDPVIFVRQVFDKAYSDQHKVSPVFGQSQDLGNLVGVGWPTEIHSSVDYRRDDPDDSILRKTRVSAFHDTHLSTMLHAQGFTDIYIAGVAAESRLQKRRRKFVFF